MQDKGYCEGFCCDVDRPQDDTFALIHCRHCADSHLVRKSFWGGRGEGVGGGRGEIQTLKLNHKVCIKSNSGPQMAKVKKITWLIFFSLPQASSRRGSAKSQINVDLETTEAFCLRGLGFFFFQPSSHLAPRLVIFPRIKLSWWNKAEGVRRRGQAAR